MAGLDEGGLSPCVGKNSGLAYVQLSAEPRSRREKPVFNPKLRRAL